jgi:four helix bundle protein
MTYNFEDRLVEFAAKTLSFIKSLPKDNVGRYYNDQILRSSGSAALNYGEAQGTVTPKDFIHKMSQVLKELRETRVSLKILAVANIGNKALGQDLLKEVGELAAISARMILNKKKEIG